MALGERIPTQLRGRRVVLRPLVARRLRRLAGGPPAQPGLAAQVGAEAAAGRSPTTPRAGPPSWPAAAPGSGSGSWAPATASASSSTAAFAGEINLSGVQRGPFQNTYVGYWIDEAQAGNGYVPEALVVAARFAFEELRPAPPPGGDHPPQPGQPPGGREARTCARRASPSATWPSTASGRTTSATPSPPRSGPTRRTELLDAWIGHPPAPVLRLRQRARGRAAAKRRRTRALQVARSGSPGRR